MNRIFRIVLFIVYLHLLNILIVWYYEDLLYTTNKNELKMRWLSRNTKVLNSFLLKMRREYLVCMIRLISASVQWQSALLAQQEWCLHHVRKKNYGSHTIAGIHNIVHANCHTCTYFFLKQTDSLTEKLVLHFLYKKQIILAA